MKLVRTDVGVTGTGNTGIGVHRTLNLRPTVPKTLNHPKVGFQITNLAD